MSDDTNKPKEIISVTQKTDPQGGVTSSASTEGFTPSGWFWNSWGKVLLQFGFAGVMAFAFVKYMEHGFAEQREERRLAHEREKRLEERADKHQARMEARWDKSSERNFQTAAKIEAIASRLEEISTSLKNLPRGDSRSRRQAKVEPG